jgi:hypothetical protein
MMHRMRFSHDLAYDAAPDAVAAMLADPAFREEVCQALHVLRHEVSVQGAGAGMTVVVDQTQPAQGVPSFAKKFVGDEIRIVQRETWRDATHADLDIEIPGKPGTMRGDIILAGDGTHTVETVTGDIRVKLPLVGGKIEEMVGDIFRSALRAEERVGASWLARGSA